MEIIRTHNETVFEQMQPGDLLEFHRGLYKHWAVVAGIYYDGILCYTINRFSYINYSI